VAAPEFIRGEERFSAPEKAALNRRALALGTAATHTTRSCPQFSIPRRPNRLLCQTAQSIYKITRCEISFAISAALRATNVGKYFSDNSLLDRSISGNINRREK
jgi:hypothetical protein